MGSEPLPVRRPHRLPPAVYAVTGHEFSFTVCARHRKSPFLHAALADSVIDSLLWTRSQYDWALFCYCLMPDHLHFLCRLTVPSTRVVDGGSRGPCPEGVLDHVARFKSYTTRQAWKLGVTGSLWQRSSYDRVIDLHRPLQEVADYVLENPVRSGLVEKWTDWPHSRVVDRWG